MSALDAATRRALATPEDAAGWALTVYLGLGARGDADAAGGTRGSARPAGAPSRAMLPAGSTALAGRIVLARRSTSLSRPRSATAATRNRCSRRAPRRWPGGGGPERVRDPECRPGAEASPMTGSGSPRWATCTFQRSSAGSLADALDEIERCADVLLIAGDLTAAGDPAEAAVLASDLGRIGVPTVAVLGNHDYHRDREADIRGIMERSGVRMLEGESTTISLADCRLAVAGTKGFGGGFPGASASEFGEREMKAFVRLSRHLAARLEECLASVQADAKIALLHYSPVEATLVGEPRELFRFLGSSLLADAVDRGGAHVALHGHAHRGCEEGVTPGGAHVRNVAQTVVIGRAYRLYRLAASRASSGVVGSDRECRDEPRSDPGGRRPCASHRRRRMTSAGARGCEDGMGGGGCGAGRARLGRAGGRRGRAPRVAHPAVPRSECALAHQRRGEHPRLQGGGASGRACARVRILRRRVLARSEGPTGRRVVAEGRRLDELLRLAEGRGRATLDWLELEVGDRRVVRLRPVLIFKRESAPEQRRYFAGPFLPTPLLRRGLVPFLPDHARFVLPGSTRGGRRARVPPCDPERRSRRKAAGSTWPSVFR